MAENTDVYFSLSIPKTCVTVLEKVVRLGKWRPVLLSAVTSWSSAAAEAPVLSSAMKSFASLWLLSLR